MVTIKLLDKALCFTRLNGGYCPIENIDRNFTPEENDYLHEAVRHLENDGYVYSEQKLFYLVSFDGLLALQETFWFMFKNKPYQRQRFQRRVQRGWLAIKIICAVLNALAIIILGILALLNDCDLIKAWLDTK